MIIWSLPLLWLGNISVANWKLLSVWEGWKIDKVYMYLLFCSKRWAFYTLFSLSVSSTMEFSISNLRAEALMCQCRPNLLNGWLMIKPWQNFSILEERTETVLSLRHILPIPCSWHLKLFGLLGRTWEVM